VHFPRDITCFRAYIYALVCGQNTGQIAKPQFLAGCNRFGIDNPCPIVTKRLANYGNPEDLEKDFKKLAEKYKSLIPEAGIDPDVIAPSELKNGNLSIDTQVKKEKYHDFNETKSKNPLKKLSGILNFTILGQKKDGDRQSRKHKDYFVGGVRMNI